jgi:hypothetical protein
MYHLTNVIFAAFINASISIAAGNPELFSFRTVLHDRWPASQGPRSDQYYIGANPQYSLTVDRPRGAVAAGGGKGSGFAAAASGEREGSGKGGGSGGTGTHSVWVLVSRHITGRENDTAVAAALTQASPSTPVSDEDDEDFVALHVHRYSVTSRDQSTRYSSVT